MVRLMARSNTVMDVATLWLFMLVPFLLSLFNGIHNLPAIV